MNGTRSEFSFSEVGLGEMPVSIATGTSPEASLVPADPLVPWRLRRDTGVRANVIVYCSREFEAEREVPNTLAYEAASAGVALYER